MDTKMMKTDEQWRAELTDEEYRVMRKKGTEEPFTGKYWNTKTPGIYTCAACGAALFSSKTKFDSKTGWPSFSDVVDNENIITATDRSHGMVRTEVKCASCGAHLGHVFDDLPRRTASGGQAGGPGPTGKRYCINSVCLRLQPEEKE